MGTGSFPVAKRPGRDVDHPLLSSAEVKERVELYIYFPSGPSWPVLGRPVLFTLARRQFMSQNILLSASYHAEPTAMFHTPKVQSMAQVVSRPPAGRSPRITGINSCGICDEQTSTRRVCSAGTWIFPCHYHTTNAACPSLLTASLNKADSPPLPLPQLKERLVTLTTQYMRVTKWLAVWGETTAEIQHCTEQSQLTPCSSETALVTTGCVGLE
jgi:hypothetical protein